MPSSVHPRLRSRTFLSLDRYGLRRCRLLNHVRANELIMPPLMLSVDQDPQVPEVEDEPRNPVSDPLPDEHREEVDVGLNGAVVQKGTFEVTPQ